jgi:hypothetical protein
VLSTICLHGTDRGTALLHRTFCSTPFPITAFAELETPSVPRMFVHPWLEYIVPHFLYFDVSNNGFIVSIALIAQSV